MRVASCTPVSYPRLPPTHQHPMWQVRALHTPTVVPADHPHDIALFVDHALSSYLVHGQSESQTGHPWFLRVFAGCSAQRAM